MTNQPLQYVPPPQNSRSSGAGPNRAQFGIVAGAGAFALWSLRRGSRLQAALAVLGGAFACMGATPAAGTLNAQARFRIYSSAEAAYKLWSNVAGAPRYLSFIESVEDLGGGRSFWTAQGVGGTPLTWTSELTDDQPAKRIAWRSTPESFLQTTGSVEFTPAHDGKGIFVSTNSSFQIPSGPLARTLMSAFGRNPEFAARESLRKFKALLETGEIPTTVGQPHGQRRASARLGRFAYRETSNLAAPGVAPGAPPVAEASARSSQLAQTY